MTTIVYDLVGTDGTDVTTASEGCDDVVGTGSMVYEAGGLVDGSTSHAIATDRRYLVTDSQGWTDWWTLVAFRQDSAPSLDTALIRLENASAVTQGSVWQMMDGTIELQADGQPTATSTETLDWGETYWFLHRWDSDGASQEVWVYALSGSLVLNLVAGAAIEEVTEHAVGIIRTGITHEAHFGPVSMSDQPLDIPIGEGTIFDYEFEGQSAGTTATAATIGATSLSGTGTAVHRNTGIITSQSSHLETTDRRYVNTTTAVPDEAWLRFLIDVPTQPVENTDLVRFNGTVGSNAINMIRMTDNGKLQVRTTSVATATSEGKYDSDGPVWCLWYGNRATETQTLQMYSPMGLLIEEISGAMLDDAIAEVSFGVIQSGGTLDMKWGRVTLSGSLLSIPSTAELEYVIVGAVTHESCELHVKAAGGSRVRVIVAGTAPQQTVPVALDADKRAMVPISALPHNSTIECTIEINDSPVGDTGWVSAGTATVPTPLPPGTPGVDRGAAWGCHGANDAADSWDDLFAQDVSHITCSGDFHYANIASFDPVDHVAPIEDQLNRGTKRMAFAHSRYAVAYCRSDHDGGVGGPGEINGYFHGDAIVAAVEAHKLIFPDVPPAGRPTETTYWSVIRGRTLHVYLDVRSNYRDDPFDPHDPAKTCLGLTQRAWLLDLLDGIPDIGEPTADAPVVGAVLYTDMNWMGDDATVGGSTTWPEAKPDAWAWYPDERALIGDAISTKRVSIMQGDLHQGLSDDGTNVVGGALLLGCAGMKRNSGNINIVRDHMTAQNYYPPPDGEGHFPSIKLQIYGIVQVADTGTAYTHTLTLRNALDAIDMIPVSRTWAVDAPTTGVTQGFGFTFGNLTAPHPLGLWQIIEPTGAPGVAAKSVARTPLTDGERLSGITRGASSWYATLWVSDLDPTGTISLGAPGVWANLRAIASELERPVEQVLAWHTLDGTVFEEADAVAVAGIETQPLAGKDAILPILFEIAQGKRRGPETLTWVRSLTSNLVDERVGIFDGSSTAITNSRWMARGPFARMEIRDGLTNNYAVWNPPGGPETGILEGQWWGFDAETWKAYRLTSETWDGWEEAEDISVYLTSGGPRTSYLPLSPQAIGGNVLDRGVLVTIQATARSEDTQIMAQGRPAFT